MAAVLRALRQHLPTFSLEIAAIDCHHNYVARECHFGADVYLTKANLHDRTVMDAVRRLIGEATA